MSFLSWWDKLHVSVHVCGMNHSSWCVTRLRMCSMTHLYVWCNSFICVTRLIYMSHGVTWRINKDDILRSASVATRATHMNVTLMNDTCEFTRLFDYVCEMTCSHVWRNSVICVTGTMSLYERLVRQAQLMLRDKCHINKSCPLFSQKHIWSHEDVFRWASGATSHESRSCHHQGIMSRIRSHDTTMS